MPLAPSAPLFRVRRIAWGAALVDIIIILTLIVALVALLAFKSLILALAVVVAALILAFLVRARPNMAKGLRPAWTAKCPKCRNIMKSKEIPCDNCGAHAVRMGGLKQKTLICARCDSGVGHPKCTKCGTQISPRFWA